MSAKTIAKGTRKDRKDLPSERQDNKKKYVVTPEMRKKGSIEGKTPIYIPKLKMVIYTSHPEDAEKLIEKYTNRPLAIFDEKKENENKAI